MRFPAGLLRSNPKRHCPFVPRYLHARPDLNALVAVEFYSRTLGS